MPSGRAGQWPARWSCSRWRSRPVRARRRRAGRLCPRAPPPTRACARPARRRVPAAPHVSHSRSCPRAPRARARSRICAPRGASAKGPAGGLTPADLASAYGYAGASGTGETVAIVDAFDDPKIEANLSTFDANYGLASCTHATAASPGLETAANAAPAADKSAGRPRRARRRDRPQRLPGCRSCWSRRVRKLSGPREIGRRGRASGGRGVELLRRAGGRNGPVELAAYDQPGEVILASAGDSGYLNWDDLAETFSTPAPRRARIASGRRLGRRDVAETRRNGTRRSETVWNNSGEPSHPGRSNSTRDRRRLQHRVHGAGLATRVAGWSATGCGTHRLDNDVAAVADPYTGFDIYDTYVYEPSFKRAGRRSAARRSPRR